MAQLANPPHNKIVLKGDFAQHDEGRLNAAAYPGMNIVMTQDPEEQKRGVYTPGGTDYVGTGTSITTSLAPLKILKENSLIGATVDTVYEANMGCLFVIPKKGDVLLLRMLSGETPARGAGVSANSAGKFVIDATNPVAELLEGGAALSEDTLVRARVL